MGSDLPTLTQIRAPIFPVSSVMYCVQPNNGNWSSLGVFTTILDQFNRYLMSEVHYYILYILLRARGFRWEGWICLHLLYCVHERLSRIINKANQDGQQKQDQSGNKTASLSDKNAQHTDCAVYASLAIITPPTRPKTQIGSRVSDPQIEEPS